MEMEMEVIKRKVKDGFIFLNEERTFKSKTFSTREERDSQIEKYIIKQIALNKEAEAKRKKEYDLTHE